jgi:hypothetical protein
MFLTIRHGIHFVELPVGLTLVAEAGLHQLVPNRLKELTRVPKLVLEAILEDEDVLRVVNPVADRMSVNHILAEGGG